MCIYRSGCCCNVKPCAVVSQKKALSGALFDYVCRRLDILEREYFGIQYEDDKKMMVMITCCLLACSVSLC